MKFNSPELFSNRLDEHSTSTPAMRVIAGVMIVLTLIGAFWTGFFPIRGSNDDWWHLKTGKILWQHFGENGFSFPQHDVFTYTGETTEWVNHEWLADMLLYAAYWFGDIQGAIVFKSLIITLTFALLILYMARNGVGWKMACTGALLAMLAPQGSFFLRPPIFTNLFVVIFLHIILYFQLGERLKFAFVCAIIGQIIWINLHGGGVIGIILIFFWWLSELWFCLVTWVNENPTAPSFKRLKWSSLVLVCIILASFINPFTYQIHLLPLKVMEDSWLVRNLGELQPPNMHYKNAFEAIILGLLMLPMMRAGSIWIYEGLAVVFFAHQALNHDRHVALFALVAVPPLFTALAEERLALFPRVNEAKRHRSIWWKLSLYIKKSMQYHLDVIVVFVLIAYIFGMKSDKIWYLNYKSLPFMARDGYIEEKYPVDSVNFLIHNIKQNQLSGPMMNDHHFAGYLIWRLSPEYMKLFTDSRFDIWGSRLVKEETSVIYLASVPIGAYDIDDKWYDFPQHITRDNIKNMVEHNPGQFPDIENWLASGKEYWEYVLDKYEINFIFTYERKPIDRLLRSEYHGWFLIYDDVLQGKEGGYVIYIRNKPENMNIIRQYAYFHREHIPEE